MEVICLTGLNWLHELRAHLPRAQYDRGQDERRDHDCDHNGDYGHSGGGANEAVDRDERSGHSAHCWRERKEAS